MQILLNSKYGKKIFLIPESPLQSRVPYKTVGHEELCDSTRAMSR